MADDPADSEYFQVHEDVPEWEQKPDPPSPMPEELEGLEGDSVHPLEGREQP